MLGKNIHLQDIRCVYFVGIGGIGMSAIARYFLGRGVEVHGYDKTETPLTRTLESEGMRIHYEERVSLIPPAVDLVIYTPAIPSNHAELEHFRAVGTPLKKRAEVLGIISRGMKTVAIAGTHGKTTTSSITTHLLRSGGIDCTAFLGGIARNLESNFAEGKSDWVVVEADEFDRSFLHLHPDIAAILSMDPDHLDIYGDHETLLETGFKAFAKNLKPGGQLWVQDTLSGYFTDMPVVQTFGVERGNAQSRNIHVASGCFVFDYASAQVDIPGLAFPLPGRHNVENATVAISIALSLGVHPEAIREGLRTFRGVKRRFELVYKSAHTAFFDDYAHHPTELEAAIRAARELFPDAEITGIFQPHLYSRTKDFADGFAAALDLLDRPLLLDIYPARELPMPGVRSEMVLERMKNPNKRLCAKEELVSVLQGHRPEVLLTLGAGDIDALVPRIAAWLSDSEPKEGTV